MRRSKNEKGLFVSWLVNLAWHCCRRIIKFNCLKRGGVNMIKKICGVLFVVGVFLILGIIGGVDNGEPLSNMWWCVPVMFVMWVLAKVGKLFDEVR